jgi:preprotein translocase subunit SecF
MLDMVYKKLAEKYDYRLLALIPPAIAVLSILIILFQGFEYGIDFKGGTWIDVLTDKKLDSSQLAQMEKGLASAGLEAPTARVGYDVDTGMEKLSIQTTSVLKDSGPVKAVISQYTGELTDYDTARVPMAERPPVELKETLEKRLRQGVDLNYTGGVLTVTGMDLNKEDLDSFFKFHVGQGESSLIKKNFNMRSVGPTLGKAFRDQGFKAIAVAFVFMGIVVFVAFRDIFPTMAVIQAGINDVLVAMAGMCVLGIPMEPASLGALLMLIGYSVDTDVLLTARVLKNKAEDFYVLVDDAMQTGLTMTFTTITVMAIVYIVSTTLTQITTLSNIAAVLIIGLFADIFATWITNVGMLKWYLERGRAAKNVGGRG